MLVTGAAGFIGSHVAAHCLDLGFDVVGVDDLSGGSVDNIPKGLVFRKGTIIDNIFLSTRRVFDPPPALPLPEGIRRMAVWVKQHGPVNPIEFDEIEVPLNLPPSWLPRRS